MVLNKKKPYNKYVAKHRQEKYFEKKKVLNKWKRQKKHLYKEANIEVEEEDFKTDDYEDNLAFPKFENKGDNIFKQKVFNFLFGNFFFLKSFFFFFPFIFVFLFIFVFPFFFSVQC